MAAMLRVTCIAFCSSALASHMTLPAGRLPAAHPLASRARALHLSEAKTDATEDEKEDRLGAGGRGGHAVRGQPELSEDEKKIQMKVMEHQKTAARLSNAEDARSLVGYSTGFGVISTNSKSLEGYPSGSVVGFAPDDDGLPVFCFSTMSGHTTDLLQEPEAAKASLTVTAAGFQGAADGRVSLIGDIKRVKDDDEVATLRELYKKKHPNAFWVEFGDFLWFRMSDLKAVRFIGGFARAGDISPDDYKGAEVDAIQAFAAPVMSHMNDDHGESTVAMVEHYIGLDQVEKADLVALDRLGFNVAITRLGQTFKLRLPFPRPAEDRKDVKALIVEMSRASAGAA